MLLLSLSKLFTIVAACYIYKTITLICILAPESYFKLTYAIAFIPALSGLSNFKVKLYKYIRMHKKYKVDVWPSSYKTTVELVNEDT